MFDEPLFTDIYGGSTQGISTQTICRGTPLFHAIDAPVVLTVSVLPFSLPTPDELVDSVINAIKGEQQRIYLGIATDGVTLELHQRFDIDRVSKFDSPSGGVWFVHGSRIAMHAHINIVSKLAAYALRLCTAGIPFASADPGLAIGNQWLGFAEQYQPAVSINNLIIERERLFYYTRYPSYIKVFAVAAWLADIRARSTAGVADPDGMILERYNDASLEMADVIIFDPVLADPYIAFAGTQPTYIEAKFVSYGLSNGGSATALQPLVSVGEGGIVMMPSASARSESVIDVVAGSGGGVSASKLTGIENNKVFLKRHHGSKPNAMPGETNKSVHVIAYTSHRIGSIM